MNKKLLFIIALVMFMVACGNPRIENEKVSLDKIEEKVSILDKEKEVREVEVDKKEEEKPVSTEKPKETARPVETSKPNKKQTEVVSSTPTPSASSSNVATQQQVQSTQAPVVVNTPVPNTPQPTPQTVVNTPKPASTPVPTQVPTATPKPAHTHNFQPIYKTVNHPAEYKTVHHDAVYENRQVEKEREHLYYTYMCPCGQYFNTKPEAQAHAEAALNEKVPGMNITFREALWSNDENIYFTALDHFPHTGELVTVEHVGYEKYYENEQVLVKEAYDEQVKVKDAWNEKVIDHHECSCGAKK